MVVQFVLPDDGRIVIESDSEQLYQKHISNKTEDLRQHTAVFPLQKSDICETERVIMK